MNSRRLILLVGAVLLIAGLVGLFVPVSVTGSNGGKIGCGTAVAHNLNDARSADSGGTQNVPVIGPIVKGMPADRAGLHVGDTLVAIDGVALRDGQQAVDLIHHSLKKPLAITYERDGVQQQARVVPVACPQRQQDGCIGFNPVTAFQRVPLGQAIVASADEFWGIALQTVGGLALILSHPVQYAPQVSGVVGMGQAAVTIQEFGWGYYFQFAAVISFALGLFNLLPIPALDGGRLAFIIAEMVRGKPVDPEKEALVHIAGFGVLLALMLVINVFNAIKIFEGKGPF